MNTALTWLAIAATAFAPAFSTTANQTLEGDEISTVVTLATVDPDSLAPALNTPDWPWPTNGIGWFPQADFSRDGRAAQSGGRARGQTSSMETTVVGPGTVRFWWKAFSSDSNDEIRFFVNGSQKKNLSGKKDWQLVTYSISSTSTQRLRWDYVWDKSSSSSGATGWVDQVEFAQVLPPLITSQPLSLTNLAGAFATFAVTVNGNSPLGYQWQCNGTNLSDGNNVSGTKSATLSLSALQLAQSGDYAAVVTNPGGVVT